MRFCVIGGSSGGKAFAAYISSKGYQVSLYNRSFSRISDIKRKGGIQAIGALEGFFPVDIATHNLKLALKDSDIIMIVTPASAHRELAKKIAPFLTFDQTIILNPGRTFGSVEFKRILEKKEKDHVLVGETQTLLFTSRELSENKVNIIKIKDSITFSAFPESDTNYIHDKLKDIFPQLTPLDNYLEVTLNNIGMIIHPAITLLNTGMIDLGKKFKFYKEGATSKVCKIIEKIESELNDIFRELGLKQFRFHKWAKKCYNVDATSVYETIQKIDAYRDINAPDQLITRYFTEDVPTGLVPTSSLGSFLNIETPMIDSLILISSILCGNDFKTTGRTIVKLKLFEYLIEHLRRKRILGKEKEGYYLVKKIISNSSKFKACCHCEGINHHENLSCWVCNLEDFRPVDTMDLLKSKKNKIDVLVKTKT